MSTLPAPIVMRSEDNYIRTYTGAKFWPLDPRPEEIQIEDVAHALSLVCRYTGHCYCLYSVADHSLRVSKLAEQMTLTRPSARTGAERIRFAREIALWGLLHDASEAYLSDLATPIKHAPGIGQIYRAYESRLMRAVVERYNLIPDEPAVVKEADRILLSTEMRDLMIGADFGGEQLPETIYPLDAQRSEVEFMRRFEALTMARKADHLAGF